MHRGYWLVCGVAALAVHALVLYGLGHSDSASAAWGASEAGEDGLEVGLGMAGSWVEAAMLEARAVAEPLHEKPVAAPIKKSKSEPEPVKDTREEVVSEDNEPVESAALAYAVASTSSSDTPVQDKPDPSVTDTSTTKDSEHRETAKPSAQKRASGRASDDANGGRKGDAKNYFSRLLSHLARHKRYPADAKKAKQEGIVKVKFSLGRDGRLLDYGISESSGNPKLDNAALSMLQDANPLPPIPDSIDRDTVTLVVPIEFSLITNRDFKE